MVEVKFPKEKAEVAIKLAGGGFIIELWDLGRREEGIIFIRSTLQDALKLAEALFAPYLPKED
ncbi:MAG: hypothetical protein KKE01_07950 [Candidatus Omnitrophica bacterium]|nr:hypothetical protein [Candidatus Omnitrophota bacterium]